MSPLLNLLGIAAPCRSMCRLHVYASAHKATDRQARTLRKSCAGCICNMVVGSNSDRDVDSDRVREDAAGRIAVP